MFDPAGLTGASVSAEVFERDCGHSVSSSAATQRPCNGQLCEEGWWAVGGWGKCLAQCGAVGPGAGAAWGMQQRSVQCTQQPCAEVEPSASRRCSVLCDACTRRPCGNRGECECAPTANCLLFGPRELAGHGRARIALRCMQVSAGVGGSCSALCVRRRLWWRLLQLRTAVRWHHVHLSHWCHSVLPCRPVCNHCRNMLLARLHVGCIWCMLR